MDETELGVTVFRACSNKDVSKKDTKSALKFFSYWDNCWQRYKNNSFTQNRPHEYWRIHPSGIWVGTFFKSDTAINTKVYACLVCESSLVEFCHLYHSSFTPWFQLTRCWLEPQIWKCTSGSSGIVSGSWSFCPWCYALVCLFTWRWMLLTNTSRRWRASEPFLKEATFAASFCPAWPYAHGKVTKFDTIGASSLEHS